MSDNIISNDTGIDISAEIRRLIRYALSKNFINTDDVAVVQNALISFFRSDFINHANCDTDEADGTEQLSINETLNDMLTYCYEMGITTEATAVKRDIVAANIVGFVAPRPSDVMKKFKLYYMDAPIKAAEYLYNLAVDLDFIKTERMKKTYQFDNEERYGIIECIINFMRAENTNEEIKSIEEMRNAHLLDYPRCPLCAETVGFMGNIANLSGRNLRTVPIKLCGENWIFRYSTFQHVNEHCFLCSERHETSGVSEKTFLLMLEFVDIFIYYFMGFNSPLPLLSDEFSEHDHFVGGADILPIENAEQLVTFTHEDFKGIDFQILNWPISTVRLVGDDKEILAKAADYIKDTWENYSDDELGILAFSNTEGEKIQHNGVSAVARKNSYAAFEIDIFLRNNHTTEECPNGLFNMREKHGHIKKGNVTLFELMGRATFAGKFDNEMLHIMSHLLSGKLYEKGTKELIDRHDQWINFLIEKYTLAKNYEEAKQIVCFETVRKSAKILDDCAVFKLDDDGQEKFSAFMEQAGFEASGFDF